MCPQASSPAAVNHATLARLNNLFAFVEGLRGEPQLWTELSFPGYPGEDDDRNLARE